MAVFRNWGKRKAPLPQSLKSNTLIFSTQLPLSCFCNKVLVPRVYGAAAMPGGGTLSQVKPALQPPHQ